MLSHDVDLAALQPQLLAWLRLKMPKAQHLSISDVGRPGAGFTNVSIPFTLNWREGANQRSLGMLFRAAGTSLPVYPDFKLERQFRVMQALQDTDVPVPRVYWMEAAGTALGFPFYIMGRIDGVVPSEYPPYHSFGVCYDASPAHRAKMWSGTLEAMARLHQQDWRRLGLSFLGVPDGGTGPLDRQLDYWEGYLNWAKEERQPVLEASLDWLRAHRFAPSHVSLCWGDARLPNTMFSPEGDVLALMDWDMAILGAPESDLAFMISLDWLLSEGTGVPRLEGFPGPEETIARYEELTGWRVEHFRFHEVFATFQAACTILRVQQNLQKMGIELPGEDPILDNFSTRRLAALLDLPAPGRGGPAIARKEELSGVVQLQFTESMGGDWYVIVEKGQAVRHEGRAQSADATIMIAREDWAAIRRGEVKPFTAWTTGKLRVAGDHALFQQLADVIAKM
jgi:aminoglycoside phosphotransferase (APT) family kinase protein/putative sterol carrier protein